MLSGFLGSGKTSCVISLADYLTRQQTGEALKLAVIENEIAESGVDDKLLEKSGLNVRALAAGCICCTLNRDMITTIKQLKEEYAPEYVIFEPSGVANPKRIWASLKRYAKEIRWSVQITVTDAARWKRIRQVTPELAANQVEGADILFLNKCDLTDEDAIKNAEAELHQLCGKALIYCTNARDGIPDSIWKEVLE